MVNRTGMRILRRVRDEWDRVVAELSRVNGGGNVRPSDSASVFHPIDGTDPNVASFEMRPVVFNLPERAKHLSTPLFVVVQGWLAFEVSPFENDGSLITHAFGTEVGYFIARGDTFAHVYGAHYDFAFDIAGHPVFHAQMKSFAELSTVVRKEFPNKLPDDDQIKGILRTVRLPIAQMDVFSVFLQLFADHLLRPGANTDDKAVFAALLERSTFFYGGASRVPRLMSADAVRCYRAVHWYPGKSA